ncbi:shikimate dehydrogenase family protein [Jannaschia seohaensis]|uniref:Shikimate dehydrogenase n=1 Tax=Jannaschia seohaensis TaxID=475081 RepID=A0A2Y9AP19_9RHOB|nr:NAD(P)-binding domain-containing protein [Jannaschia seohaensis]PWJ19223.1 shikimate dehydrogenase [Jannaschia seohaensis]SSA45885.1 shikimate dehydrogenase [Jannaschia seohaensis]
MTAPSSGQKYSGGAPEARGAEPPSALTPLRCGLIGENIGRSRLALALAIMAEDHGGRLEFTPIDTADDPSFDFDATVARLMAEGWTGVTVTHPWKTHAAAWAGAAMVPEAQGLGASNTLTFHPVTGHNTDHAGFLAAWPAILERPPGRVAVAGAGGVARAIVPALITLGATEVSVWDLNPDAATELAARTGARAVAADAAQAVTRAADGLVNCTPRGMAPDTGSAFPADWIGGQSWAFDAVYTPTETPFLRTARAAGLAVMTGFDLFRYMAMASFAAYTGIRPDPATTLPKLDALKPE